MDRIYGVVVGVVDDLDDPQGEGRIRVRFPWMGDKSQSFWAPVAAFMAGPERGAWFMPEKEDEVLVAFEQGQPNHPFILGFLWNGQEKPPSEKTSIRRLKTVSGHVLEFDDRQGNHAITITTAAGHEITLDDPGGEVSLKSKGGHEMTLDDQGGKIDVKSTGGQEVSLQDRPIPTIEAKSASGASVTIGGAPPSVKVEAPVRVQVQCMQASVTANAALNITAPITIFSGVVQVPTLIAQSVVSAAYTPAPGNLLGL